MAARSSYTVPHSIEGAIHSTKLRLGKQCFRIAYACKGLCLVRGCPVPIPAAIRNPMLKRCRAYSGGRHADTSISRWQGRLVR